MKKYRVPVVIGGAIRVADENAETDILDVVIPENPEAYPSKYVGNVVVEAESAVIARDEVLHRIASGVNSEAIETKIGISCSYLLYLLQSDTERNGRFNTISYKMEEPNNLSKPRHTRLVGQMSNLITDMMMDGTATKEELLDAIYHSLVMIDAYSHNLDYKQSAEDHHIKELLAKYRKVRK